MWSAQSQSDAAESSTTPRPIARSGAHVVDEHQERRGELARADRDPAAHAAARERDGAEREERARRRLVALGRRVEEPERERAERDRDRAEDALHERGARVEEEGAAASRRRAAAARRRAARRAARRRAGASRVAPLVIPNA